MHVADTSVVKIIQEPDYTSSDLLSDIGGQLGLWIGMSVLSFGEIIQLIFDTCLYFHFWHSKGNKTTDVKPVEDKQTNEHYKPNFENYE